MNTLALNMRAAQAPNPSPAMDEALAVQALAALAQSSRLRVFRAIVGAGPEGLQPGQIALALSLPANSLSFHLKELSNAGLIGWQREGRFLRYRAHFDQMQSLVHFLTAHCCHGAPCPEMPGLMPGLVPGLMPGPMAMAACSASPTQPS